jgi:hypothetical protein
MNRSTLLAVTVPTVFTILTAVPAQTTERPIPEARVELPHAEQEELDGLLAALARGEVGAVPRCESFLRDGTAAVDLPASGAPLDADRLSLLEGREVPLALVPLLCAELIRSRSGSAVAGMAASVLGSIDAEAGRGASVLRGLWLDSRVRDEMDSRFDWSQGNKKPARPIRASDIEDLLHDDPARRLAALDSVLLHSALPGDPEPGLLACLDHPLAAVRLSALSCLAPHCGKSVAVAQRVLEFIQDIRRPASERAAAIHDLDRFLALGDRREEVAAILFAIETERTSTDARVAAILKIHEYVDDRTKLARLLRRNLGDPAPQVRVAAIALLGSWWQPEDRAMLLREARRGSPRERVAALTALVEHEEAVKDPASMLAFLAAIGTVDQRIQDAGLLGLGLTRD